MFIVAPQAQLISPTAFFGSLERRNAGRPGINEQIERQNVAGASVPLGPVPMPVDPSGRLSLAVAETLLSVTHSDCGGGTVHFTVTVSF